MALALWKVDLPAVCGLRVFDGKHSALVWANSAAEAKQAVAAASTSDIDAAWLSGTTTEITQPTENYVGWVFTVILGDNAITKSYTGLALDDIDDVGVGLKTALNTSAIDGADYTAGTNLLLIAEGGGADDLGDEASITFTVTPPAGLFPTGYIVDSASFFTSLVQDGAADDDLSVVLVNGLPGSVTFIAG